MTKPLWLVLVTALLLGGCANHKDTQPLSMVLAQPLQVDYLSEAQFVRLGQLIDSGKFQDDKLSQLYYERGLVLSKMGLGAMARLDFSRAIHVTPDYAPAYNFLGLYYLQNQDLDNAYEAFDSVIELDPNYDYAYFSRALALYYGHKYQLSEKDIQRYQIQTPNDPYRVLWQYLISVKINPKAAHTALIKAYHRSQNSYEWGWQLVALFADELTPSQLLAKVQPTQDNKLKAEQLCEAYFYLGKQAQLTHQSELAQNDFKLSLANNVYDYVEHGLALLELKIYRQKLHMQEREL
ncbi:lipoprotein NlpI [Celerinatantimonas yamalensis]|uniref:Lipoprotein NlpI n=1 Tax=Celerinatantimonas yamalensis TaxID=559956 RepID=A0ABW9G6N6_9GAMM